MSEPFIITRSGRRVHLNPPRVDEIFIDDIAHGLSNCCRFVGQCEPFYSVAQHSVLAARLLRGRRRFKGLMHDSTEAYLGDVSKPLKELLKDYKKIEAGFWKVICRKFFIDAGEDAEIKRIDSVLYATERRDLFIPETFHLLNDSEKNIIPLRMKIIPWTPGQARAAFMREFLQLTVPVA